MTRSVLPQLSASRGPEPGPSAGSLSDDKNDTYKLKFYKQLINAGRETLFQPNFTGSKKTYDGKQLQK